MFGEGIRTKLNSFFNKLIEEEQLNITSEKLIAFTECITDQTLSKNLSYQILDSIASEDYELLKELVLKEYKLRNMVLSISLREYPDLFNRRIYIPLRDNLLEMALKIITSLRTVDNEEASLLINNKNYPIKYNDALITNTMLNIREFDSVVLVYGNDSWTFDIKPIGLTYVNDDEYELPFIVEDAVGYGIMGMSKQLLFNQLEDSKDLALDTKNPIMDDEEYEFYNADTDSINENSIDDYYIVRKEYLGNE